MEKIPLLVMSAASAVITVYAQRRGGAVEFLTALPLGQRFRNAIYSYVMYLASGMWPSGLAAFYPHPEASLPLCKVLEAAAELALLSAMDWRPWHRLHPVEGTVRY